MDGTIKAWPQGQCFNSGPLRPLIGTDISTIKDKEDESKGSGSCVRPHNGTKVYLTSAPKSKTYRRVEAMTPALIHPFIHLMHSIFQHHHKS